MGEYYMLKDSVWKQVHDSERGMLCIGCLETRLGRKLIPLDFAVVPLNDPKHAFAPRSQRLQDRLTSTKELQNAFDSNW